MAPHAHYVQTNWPWRDYTLASALKYVTVAEHESWHAVKCCRGHTLWDNPCLVTIMMMLRTSLRTTRDTQARVRRKWQLEIFVREYLIGAAIGSLIPTHTPLWRLQRPGCHLGSLCRYWQWIWKHVCDFWWLICCCCLLIVTYNDLTDHCCWLQSSLNYLGSVFSSPWTWPAPSNC